MVDVSAYVELDLETKQPVEIVDFVSVFASISSQYEKFVQENYPDLRPEARIYVTELRHGSIHADLIPTVIGSLVPLVDDIRKVIVARFVGYLIDRISPYFAVHGRVQNASKSDLSDFAGLVQAVANDPDGKSAIEAAVYEDGKKDIKIAL